MIQTKLILNFKTEKFFTVFVCKSNKNNIFSKKKKIFDNVIFQFL